MKRQLVSFLLAAVPVFGISTDQTKVINHWLEQGSGVEGDFNRDNIVGLPDWAVVTGEMYSFIIDDKDANYTFSTGKWIGSGSSGSYNSGSKWSRNAATFAWKFRPPIDGQYEVFMWWTAAATRASNVPVDIINAGEPARVLVNQQANGGKWNSLGVYNFAGGNDYKVIETAVIDPCVSTCADAVRIVQVNFNKAPVPLPPGPTENIYVCKVYSWSGTFLTEVNDLLVKIGAENHGNYWTYTNPAKRTNYNINYVTTLEGMEAALAEPNSHIVVNGHSNYGLAASFATDEEFRRQRIYDVKYVDDDRFLKCGSEMVGMVIDGMQLGQVYPNWGPFYKDGTSALAPYDVSEGTPPYNYYITYRIPGDPTYYRFELSEANYVERFPDSPASAWYSSSGARPDANVSPQYFMANNETYFSRGQVTGSWSASGTAGIYKDTGYNGYNYLYRNAGTGANKVTFTMGINQAGRYEVSGSWFPQADHTAHTEYIINHAGGTSTVYVDQTRGNTSSFWNYLGTFNFNQGESTVIATDNATSGVVIADGVLLTPVDNRTDIVQSEFRVDNRSGSAPVTVQFTNYSLVMENTQSRLWDFGDGTTSTAASPSHTYTSAGIYTVSLTTTDNAGNSDTKTKSNYIYVNQTPTLNAEFHARTRTGKGRTSIKFYNESHGGVTRRLWSFGDGTTSTQVEPTHVYYTPGTYNVTLTVYGTSGSHTHTENAYIYIAKTPIYADNQFAYKAHYYTGTSRPTPKTIVKTKGRLQDSDLKYARMFWGTCNSDYYFIDVFHRGIMFYTVANIEHYTGVEYLEGYLKGLDDANILKLVNLVQPVHGYYDFNLKPPSMR
jgi:PKD repeat protein